MISFCFKIIKRFVLAALLIYSLDVFLVSLGLSIPINFYTILVVALFGIPALICLIVFLLLF